MAINHERETIMKLAKKEIKKVDAFHALDMSKCGGTHKLLNIALDVIREVGTNKIEKLLK
jgi:hypothetical protein